ncbi:hypothetical protein [Methanocorpusculum sp. GPch4]|uniref:hypothetical protein n=1 Tax=Methanocorpusculum sp. GPch4 TaxID=2527877 RepID=UPI001432DC21|nr:hypothetical protein [Methanocorpusculum sp. GPch4]
MTEQTKNTQRSVICMALIYLLPLCISSADFSLNLLLPRTVTDGLFSSLMFLLPIAALIGVLTYRKTLGRENTTWFTVLIIALVLLLVINIGMGITNIIGGAFTSQAMLTHFLRTPMWVTVLYFVLILAPLFSLVVPKFCEARKPQKILSGVSKGFAVFSIFYLIYAMFRGIAGDAYDVVVPGMPPAYPWYISQVFMLSLSIIWVVFGLAVGACMIWLCRKSENDVCMRNGCDEK